MTEKERIHRLEFLIRLMVIYTECLEAGEPSTIVAQIINEYCDANDISNPFEI